MTNPLLNFKQAPQFETIEAKHVIPALETVLQESRANIAELQHDRRRHAARGGGLSDQAF